MGNFKRKQFQSFLKSDKFTYILLDIVEVN